MAIVRRALLALTLVALLYPGGAGANGRFDEGMLWRLDPPDGGRPSYLLGTMHVSDPRVLDVPMAVRLALAASDVAVFELIEEPGATSPLLASALFTDGRDLETVLGPELWARASTLGMDYGIVPSLLRRMEPWVPVLFFSMPIEQVRDLMAGATVLDTLLQEMALEAGKELRALETAEEQIAAFRSLSEDDQVALLRATVDAKDELDAAFDLMIELYLAGDLAGLAAVAEASVTDEEAALVERFMAAIKVERDALMFERLQPMLPGGGLFIAVGALHLAGEGGLLARFAQAGWNVGIAD